MSKKKIEKNQSALKEEDKEKDNKDINKEEKIPIEKQEKPKRKPISIKWQAIFIIFFALLVLIAIIIEWKYAPNIILEGTDKITLNYKEKYKESGYKLIINGKNYPAKVKVKGKVNSKKLGKYVITYSYKKGFFKSKRKRIIYVKDLTKPAIILNGAKEVYICPNKEYKEEGYKAIDNYDKDITPKVKIKKEKDKYTYIVSDSFKNKTVIERKIIKKDRIKPTITLKNNKTTNIVVGTPYKEEGYTAQDNCDQDLTDKVKVEGNIDINTPGSYHLTYSVSDSANNKTEVVRTINVVKKSSNGTIYLTFDDGPQNETTNVILDILKEENVKATFFVTNNGPDELIKRAYDEGHSIGLHTATHNYSQVYSSEENYFNDLQQVQDRVLKVTGYKSTVIRFPGGSSNTISRKYKQGIMTSLTEKVLASGYKYYDWNLSSGDAGVTTDPNKIYDIVTNGLSHDRVNVILMHDTKKHTRDSLKRIIQYAKENGYTFDIIDQNTEMVTQRVNN